MVPSESFRGHLDNVAAQKSGPALSRSNRNFEELRVSLTQRGTHLRYGENPHQKATWYSSNDQGWDGAYKLQGKEISTNNLLDLEAALSTIREFYYGEQYSNESFQHAAVVIKHTNPCGVAIGSSIDSALTKALDADRTSAFGGITVSYTHLTLPTKA